MIIGLKTPQGWWMWKRPKPSVVFDTRDAKNKMKTTESIQ